MAMTPDEMLGQLNRIIGLRRPWASRTPHTPIQIIPGVTAVYYEISGYRLDYARRTWSRRGLFVWRQMLSQLEALENPPPSFDVIYGFACDSYLTAVFPTCVVSMDRSSYHGRDVLMDRGHERGWYIPMRLWSELRFEQLVGPQEH